MDNPNPIRYSDLLTPDSSVTDLIAQLEQLNATYDKLKGDVQGQATAMAKSMQGLSGATEEQRRDIMMLTETTEKLEAEYRKIYADQIELKGASVALSAARKEEKQALKLLEELNVSAEGSYKRLSAQYRLIKMRLNEMSLAEREGTGEGRKLVATAKALYEEMNRLQKETGKATLQVGQYERALGGALGVGGKWLDMLTDAGKRQETLNGILAAVKSPIGIAIGAIGGAVAAYKLFKDSIHETQSTGDEFDYAMGGWRGTWEVFKKSISTVDFNGFIIGAREAMLAGRELAQVLDEAFERSNSIRLMRASMSEENAILQEAMRNQGLSLDERIEAGNKYLANMAPIYEREKELALDNARAQLNYLYATTNRVERTGEMDEAVAKHNLAMFIEEYDINRASIAAAQQYLKDKEDLANKELGIQYAQDEKGKKIAQEQIDTLRMRIDAASEGTLKMVEILKQYGLTSNEQVKAYVDAVEKYYNASAAAYNDQKRIVTMVNNLEAQRTQQAITESNKRKKSAEDEAKAKEKAEKDEIAMSRAVLQAEAQSISLQIEVTKEGTQEMLDLRIEAIRKQWEIALFENRQKAEELRQDEAAIDAKYQNLILKTTADFNTKLAQRDLAAAQSLAAAKFALENKNEREITIFRLQQEKERLEETLRINETAAQKMTQTEVEAAKATIDGIKKQLSSLGYNNIYEVLGISLNSQQQSALNTALGTLRDSLGSLADSWKSVADAAVDAAQKQVDAAQRALDAEIEARNNGYANNVKMAQKELALSQKNLAEAQREQEKAQRAQIALDTITQASSLITATANIWKAFGEFPPAAIAATALMWGSFLAAKVKAFQVAGAGRSEQYGEGTVELLQGGSHASGHDIDLGTKRDGTRRRAEGGEYFAVINKRNSRRYGSVIPDVINAFNDGTFADKYQKASAAMDAAAVNIIAGGRSADLSGLEKNVEAIRKQGDASRYVDGTGATVVQYKNLTRKIKS